jgi:hypothetical protein
LPVRDRIATRLELLAEQKVGEYRRPEGLRHKTELLNQGWKPTLRHSGAGSKILPFVTTR